MKLFIFAVSTLFSVNAFSSSITDASITMMMISKEYGNKVYIKTNKPHNTSEPSCHSSTWSFVFKIENEADKNMYSMLLAAHMSGKKTNLVGTHNCNDHTSIEGLERIELKN